MQPQASVKPFSVFSEDFPTVPNKPTKDTTAVNIELPIDLMERVRDFARRENPGEGSVLPVEILSKIGGVIDALEKMPEEKCNEQVKKIVWLVEAVASSSAAAVKPNEPKCQILGLIENGGMGVVYKARQ